MMVSVRVGNDGFRSALPILQGLTLPKTDEAVRNFHLGTPLHHYARLIRFRVT